MALLRPHPRAATASRQNSEPLSRAVGRAPARAVPTFPVRGESYTPPARRFPRARPACEPGPRADHSSTVLEGRSPALGADRLPARSRRSESRHRALPSPVVRPGPARQGRSAGGRIRATRHGAATPELGPESSLSHAHGPRRALTPTGRSVARAGSRPPHRNLRAPRPIRPKKYPPLDPSNGA